MSVLRVLGASRRRSGAHSAQDTRGSALAVVLMTMMFLITLGMAALTYAMSADLTVRATARYEQDYYTAESGLQFALCRLQSPDSPVPAALSGELARTRDFAGAAAAEASALAVGERTAEVSVSCAQAGGRVLISLRSSCGGRTLAAELEYTERGYLLVSYRELGSDTD